MGRLRRRHVAEGVSLTEAQAEELVLGPGGLGDTPGISSFESAGDRKRAWAAHRERLTIEAAAHAPGHRPWAYWVLDCDRPDLARVGKESDPDRVRELAGRGELYALEVEELERIGREAQARIGTAHERRGPDPDDPNGWDRIEARVARVMRAGLGR